MKDNKNKTDEVKKYVSSLGLLNKRVIPKYSELDSRYRYIPDKPKKNNVENER